MDIENRWTRPIWAIVCLLSVSSLAAGCGAREKQGTIVASSPDGDPVERRLAEELESTTDPARRGSLLFELSLNAAERNDFDAAGRWTSRLVAERPEWVDGWLLEGLVRNARHEWPEMTAASDRALALAPENPLALALSGMGRLLVDGAADEALRLTTQAFTIEPTMPMVANAHVMALLAANRRAEIEALLVSLEQSEAGRPIARELREDLRARLPLLPEPGSPRLPELRRGLDTRYRGEAPADEPIPAPPPSLFEVVRYDAPLGSNVAYLSVPSGSEPGPAIVWVQGGFHWNLNDTPWQAAPRSHDESARAFREAGVRLMWPALRGANGNPGRPECLLGEVDDVIAAGRYLASRPDVDPRRIYLGGHSTGASIALLAAASTSDVFRGIFAFGPVADVRGYRACLPADAPIDEVRARAPAAFLGDVRNPVFVIEGKQGNAESAAVLARRRRSAPVRIVLVSGGDHFDILAPGTELVARAILVDTGETPRFEGLEAALGAMMRP